MLALWAKQSSVVLAPLDRARPRRLRDARQPRPDRRRAVLRPGRRRDRRAVVLAAVAVAADPVRRRARRRRTAAADVPLPAAPARRGRRAPLRRRLRRAAARGRRGRVPRAARQPALGRRPRPAAAAAAGRSPRAARRSGRAQVTSQPPPPRSRAASRRGPTVGTCPAAVRSWSAAPTRPREWSPPSRRPAGCSLSGRRGAVHAGAAQPARGSETLRAQERTRQTDHARAPWARVAVTQPWAEGGPRELLALQRTAGNAAVCALVAQRARDARPRRRRPAPAPAGIIQRAGLTAEDAELAGEAVGEAVLRVWNWLASLVRGAPQDEPRTPTTSRPTTSTTTTSSSFEDSDDDELLLLRGRRRRRGLRRSADDPGRRAGARHRRALGDEL